VEPIVVQAKGREILQDNCVRCHGDLVHALTAQPEGSRGPLNCTHCHAGAGHGEKTGLGGPLKPAELRPPPSRESTR
jgi:cytochrome c nitrite reductase small subunit